MAMIQPKILVCLGRIAAMRLINDKFRITKDFSLVRKEGPAPAGANLKLDLCRSRRAAAARIYHGFVTKEHGIWYDAGGIRMMAIYHPSALLRDPSKRPPGGRHFTILAM